MRVLKRSTRYAGRHPSRCDLMGYARRMDDRRRTVGRRIKRERQRRGYSSQRAFAKAIGIDASSAAYAESGDERIAIRGKVFAAIEDHFGWPEDSITRYLETGEEADLEALKPPQPRPAQRPLTLTEQRLIQVYVLLRQMGLTEADAQRLAFQVGRQLELDEAVLMAAIERQPAAVD